MITEFIKKSKYILIINILVILCFVLGYGHYGDIIYDSFREAYIPSQMINGEVLYKNIFSIYAPFAYLFNAFLFKLFGIKLNVLYFAGLFATIGICNFIYLISTKFLNKNISFIVTFVFILSSVLSPNVFNTFFPYSYGMVYGLLFILICIFSLLNNNYALSYLFYSLAVCSKYEFILLLPLIVYMSNKDFFSKETKTSIKEFIIKNLIYLINLLLPVTVIGILLYMQGVRFDDIFSSFQIILSMSTTKTLYWFYSVMGLIFREELIPIYLVNVLKFLIPVVILYFYNKLYIYPFLIVYAYFAYNAEIFIYLYPLILIMFVLRYRELELREQILVISSMLISMKVFFALTIGSYGIYFLPFGLISLLILLPKRLKVPVSAVILLCGISLGINNIKGLINKQCEIKAENGIIYANEYLGRPINHLIEYVSDNISPKDRVVVFPECLAVNFLANRKSDGKFYSLIPLYVETFGEDIIQSRIERIRPEYIIISNYDTSIYYYSHFGQDYAGQIYEYILNNYENIEKIGHNFSFDIFRIKNYHPSEKPVL